MPHATRRALATGVVHCGDNLDVLRAFPARCVDLAYLDPPFHARRDFAAFDDRHASAADYVAFMRPRCDELARRAAEAAGLPGERIFGGPGTRLGLPLAAPRFRVLTSERGQLLPPLADAVRRYCHEAVERWRPSNTIAQAMTTEETIDVACSS